MIGLLFSNPYLKANRVSERGQRLEENWSPRKEGGERDAGEIPE